MEQARHARIPVHLNAVLIGEKTVPKGCKVRNVSGHGLLLQCDADGRILTFRDGDHVDIHLLFQRPDGTKYLTITATVRHVDANGIGVEFCQPDPELVKLIESYRTDETQSLEASISHRRKSAGPARSATVVTHPASGSAAHTARRQQKEERSGRRISYIGSLLLLIAVAIISAAYLGTSGLGPRLTGMEKLMRSNDGALDRLQSQFLRRGATVTATDKPGTPLTSGGSVSAPETESAAATPLQQSSTTPAPAPGTAAISGSREAPLSPATGMSQEQKATAAMTAEPAGLAGGASAAAPVGSHDAETHGPWVINLLSSPSKSEADRFALKAEKLGIPAVTQSSIILKDKEYFRVQVTGFQTYKQAGERAGPIKEKLGLKDVWIFKP